MIVQADARRIPLADGSVHCVVTSQPYWGLRDYGVDGQIGLEKTLEAFVETMVEVFREVRRVLRDDGTCWVNLGDSYSVHKRKTTDKSGPKQRRNAGSLGVPSRCAPDLKPKDLCGIPWRVALALQADGWWLRSAMPWVKRSAMPESVTDRAASALEYVFHLVKSERYFWDMEAVRKPPSGIMGGACFGGPAKEEKAQQKIGSALRTQQRAATKEDRERYAAAGRNFRNADLWFESIEGPHGLCGVDDELVGLDVTSEAYKQAHFATFPTKLVEPLILASTSARGCCPACGAPWKRILNRTETLGWQPSCKCGRTDTVPAIVLDPFSGSGTTVRVARAHGRIGIGLELNPEYIEQARVRTLVTPPLFAEVG